jgi:hypothetical protein
VVQVQGYAGTSHLLRGWRTLDVEGIVGLLLLPGLSTLQG